MGGLHGPFVFYVQDGAFPEMNEIVGKTSIEVLGCSGFSGGSSCSGSTNEMDNACVC